MLFIRKVSFLFQKRRQTTRAYLFADFFDAWPFVGMFFAPNEAPGLPTEAQTFQRKPRRSNGSPDAPLTSPATYWPLRLLEEHKYGQSWYSRPELNRDQRFRKPLLYPFELRE